MADIWEPGAVEADVELYKRLHEVECDGLEWKVTEHAYFHYGWAVMLAWLKSGLISAKCYEKSRMVRLPEYWSEEDQEDVAAVAVADGTAMFRRAIVDDLWDPSLGASLKSYFLGGCVLAFPNAMRGWQRYQRRYQGAFLELVKQAEVHRQQTSPASVVEAVAAVDELVRDESARNQAIMRLLAAGYEQVEIAEILRMTPGAVHARLSRLRGRFRGDTGRAL